MYTDKLLVYYFTFKLEWRVILNTMIPKELKIIRHSDNVCVNDTMISNWVYILNTLEIILVWKNGDHMNKRTRL